MSEKLVIITGLSGAGKTVLVEHALRTFPLTGKTLSCTTRLPREGEINGVHYRFFSREEFALRVVKNEFAEYKPNVYGNAYGTRREDIEDACRLYPLVFFVIDIQGMHTLSRVYPNACTVFINANTKDLKERLRARNLAPDDFRRRCGAMRGELALARKERFHFIIENPNGRLSETTQEFTALILQKLIAQYSGPIP